MTYQIIPAYSTHTHTKVFHITVYYFLISHCKDTSLFIFLAHPTVSEPTGQFPTRQSTLKGTAVQPTGTLWKQETSSAQLPTGGPAGRARPVGAVPLAAGHHPLHTRTLQPAATQRTLPAGPQADRRDARGAASRSVKRC